MTNETINEITSELEYLKLKEIKDELIYLMKLAKNKYTRTIISSTIQDIDNSAVLIF